MKIIKAKNAAEMSKKAATIIINEVILNQSAVLGLATGSTPLGLYKELIKSHKEMSVDFSHVTTFNLDEYHPIVGSQSYRHFMFENLFDHINLNKRKINLLDGCAKDPWQECKNFEKRLMDTRIDIQILGIGSNGHIAFNEPNSKFDTKTRVVNLTESTIKDNARFFKSIDDVPKRAMTEGLATIIHSKKIILLASGQNKADAVKKMIEGPVTESCPASILQHHPDVVVIITEDAASLLRQETTKVAGYKIYTENNIPKGKNIVVISPHPDDSCINAGGTIALLSESNTVHNFIMTSGHRSYIPDTNEAERVKIREKEANEEAKILRTIPHFLFLDFYDNGKKSMDKDVERIYKELKIINPDIIILPQRKDTHPTHAMAREFSLAALKRLKNTELWFYESTWGLFSQGDFNAIVSLPHRYIRKKIKAIRKHKSQITRTRYDIAAKALAKLRGAIIPEQNLIGYGKRPIKIDEDIELYFVEDSKK